MPRKGENIYKRKDGRWEGRYIRSRTETGKAVYGYVYAHSYSDVRKKLLTAQQASLSSVSVSIVEPPLRSVRFDELADAWLNTRKPLVKESTYIKYRNSLKNYLLPRYGKTEIQQITDSMVENYASQLLVSGGSCGRGLSPKTVSDVITILREILYYAERHGYAVNNIGRKIVTNSPGKELTILTTTEQQRLQQYLLCHISSRNLGLLICLYTGIRIGELCSLRWEDVSLAENYIYIHSTMQRLQCEPGSPTRTKVAITAPKSICSVRKIPLPDRLVDLITEYYPETSGYVLTCHDTRFTEPRTMQNHFQRILKECGIHEVNFHALRHTFATRCIELGFDVKSLSEILGHSSVSITMNRYVHPTMDHKRENMNRLSELIAVNEKRPLPHPPDIV